MSTADICEYLMVLMDQELSTLIEDDSLEPVRLVLSIYYFKQWF